jgi:hypothetical protein
MDSPAGVLFDDLFNALFLKLLNLRHHHVLDILTIARNVYEDAKDRLIERGCLPKIKDNTRLLVINDEAQFLGDQFNSCFQSMSSSTSESPRPPSLSNPTRLPRYRSTSAHACHLWDWFINQHSFLGSELRFWYEGQLHHL